MVVIIIVVVVTTVTPMTTMPTMPTMVTVTMVTTVTPSELSFGIIRPRESNATLSLGYGRRCKGARHNTKGGGQQQGRVDPHDETCLNEKMSRACSTYYPSMI